MIWLVLFIYIGMSVGVFMSLNERKDVKKTDKYFPILLAICWPILLGGLIVQLIPDEKEKN